MMKKKPAIFFLIALAALAVIALVGRGTASANIPGHIVNGTLSISSVSPSPANGQISVSFTATAGLSSDGEMCPNSGSGPANDQEADTFQNFTYKIDGGSAVSIATILPPTQAPKSRPCGQAANYQLAQYASTFTDNTDIAALTNGTHTLQVCAIDENDQGAYQVCDPTGISFTVQNGAATCYKKTTTLCGINIDTPGECDLLGTGSQPPIYSTNSCLGSTTPLTICASKPVPACESLAVVQCAIVANTAATCGGAITVMVTPPTATVQTGASQQFTATVTGSSNTSVTWSVNGVVGGNSTAGTITAAGLYTAPVTVPSPVTVTVTAVSAADSTSSGSATVTVTLPPTTITSVSASCLSPVQVNATSQCTATVSGTGGFNNAVTWSIVSGGGSINSGTGLYTAPGSPTTAVVKATSVQDPTKSNTASITVTAIPPTTGTIIVKSQDSSGAALSASWVLIGPVGTACEPTACSGSGTNTYSSQPANPTNPTAYTIAPTAPGGYIVDAGDVLTGNIPAGGGSLTFTIVFDHTAAPTVTLSASGPGSPTTLTWTSTGATSCGSPSPAGWTASSATNGSQSVNPAVTTTYTLTCTGPGGSTVSNPVTVTVGAPSAPSVTLTPSQNPIVSGGSTVLTWTSSGATSCSAPWTASTLTNGSQSVSPAVTTTYTITCTGPGGSGMGSATVTVSPPSAPLTITLQSPPTEAAGVPVGALCSGGTGSYTWSSTGPASFGTTTGNNTTVTYATPSQPGNYTLTCKDSAGSTATATIVITPDCTINPPTSNIVPPASVTLTWSCPAGVAVPNSCSITGVGANLPTSGSTAVAPTQNTTYVLSCIANNGFSSVIPSSSASISIQGPGGHETNP